MRTQLVLALSVTISSTLLPTLGCSRPSPPTLTPEKAIVTRVDVSGMALDITMSATNPNASDLTATGITSHVVVDETHDVGTVTLPSSVTIPAGQTTKIDVPFTMKWSDVTVLAQFATSSGPVPYSVDGTLQMGGSLLSVNVPFHLDGTITHEQVVAAMMNSVPVLR